MAYIGTKPANQVIDSTLIADGTVTTADIADNAITTAKIAAGAVVPADLSTGAPFWDTSGNVGLGTTSPTSKLHVVGDIVLPTGANRSIHIGSGTNYDYSLQCNGDDFQIIEARDSNKTRLRIKYSGTPSLAGQLQLPIAGGSTLYNAYTCRAWVNYSSYGSNTIYGSGNVSSITDLSLGRTRINFTTAMPDTNYAVVIGAGDDQIVWNGGASLASVQNGLKTTSYTSIHLSNSTFSDTEYYEVSIAIFR
jgi:hypothetical protein